MHVHDIYKTVHKVNVRAQSHLCKNQKVFNFLLENVLLFLNSKSI